MPWRWCLAAAAITATACATTQKEAAADAFGSNKGGGAALEPAGGDAVINPAVSPEKFAKSFKRPVECEHAARSAKKSAPDRAWLYLRACVNRGGFNLLQPLLDNWLNDLKTRPEAPTVLADVIAARGGHVRTDLQTIQQKRLPVFDLASAIMQPGTYKGRYVVFVAKVSTVRNLKGRTEVALAEMSLGAEQVDVVRGLKSVSSSSASGQASFKSTRYGSGSAQGSYDSTSSSAKVESTFQESFEETGQEIVGKLTKPDPFLTIDRHFLFLARFDGAKESDTSADDESTSEDPVKVALVSVVSYHDLNAQYTWQ